MGDFKMRRYIWLSLFLLLSCSQSDTNTGLIQDKNRGRNIEYQVWQPSNLNGTYPLILLSHGSGGDPSNHIWLINSLVENGYLVAAPTHPLNNTRDNSDIGVISVWERPADLSLMLDTLLGKSVWSSHIDPDRIGAAGFSSGGYSVISLGGALYDWEMFKEYCNGESKGPDCSLAEGSSGIDFAGSSISYKDERIKAIFAMAPAVGPAITEDSLKSITVPVLITASKDDELVLPEFHALRYANHIPGSELELLEIGGHFIFLECNIVTHVADWFIKELDLCGKAFNVDRGKIRREVADSAIKFFELHIGESSP